ncbi:MAG: electron transport complex subunit RsxC [Clostridiales bacterium]|nr:electron transport complex subunit RsxC [Clostridiales bacterium]
MAIKGRKIFQPGIKIPDMKYLTEDKPIEQMPAPKTVYISMSQGIGAAAKPIVSVGDRVKKGQKTGQADGVVSANVFASVAGTVTAIKDIQNPNSKATTKYVVIENDFSEEEEFLPPLKEITKETIIERIREAGIVGLGGAGFPTAVKLSGQKPVEMLIVNGAECEPYLTCDYRLMMENSDEINKGIRYVAQALGVTDIRIGIEENKPKAIEKYKKVKDFQLFSLKKKYPQGSEKTLIAECARRKVPWGKLPIDIGVVVINVATAFTVYQAVEKNIPLYERVLTVAGKGVDNPRNLRVRIGTKTQDIIEYCGDINKDAVKIVRGGPMMGKAMHTVDGYTKKTDSGIVVLTAEETNTSKQSACINCGRCAKKCPMHLMSMKFDEYASIGRFDMAERFGVMNCLECGCCSFVCPAKRSIVQSVVLCKQKIAAKKGGK